MEKQRKREEIEEKYKWDLTKIYKKDEDWYNDLEELKKEIEKITDYETNLFDNIDNFKAYLKLEETIQKLSNKLGIYANLRICEDGTNTKYQQMMQYFQDTYQVLEEKSSFYNELFYKQDYDKLRKMMEKDDYLKTYIKTTDNAMRYKNHYISKDKEVMLSKLSSSLNAASDIYSMLTDTELKYGTIKDEEGKEVELTDSNFSTYFQSKDRRVRHDAFKEMYKTQEKYKNTLALTYSSDIDANVAISEIYNHNDVLKQSLFSDNIAVEVYDNLIKSVHNNLDKLYKYYDFKKELLKLDEVHLYDLSAKVVECNSKKYSFEEAKELILKVIEVYGDDYVKKAKAIFDNRLVDVYNNVGKTSGAFSSSTYDTDPFILLNYEERYRDVSTLIHELGHSMHSTYSTQNNLRQYADYKIFVAEVASTTNELLLAYYLLDHSSDENEKLAILNELLDNFKATIYRQTMFAEFEREMYRKRQNKEPLTNDIICDYYYDLNKKYFGDNVVVDDEIRYEWQRVPHFYTPFYVYKYATSMSAAVYIADKIYSGDKEFTKKYIEFLSMGGREFPIDELKTLGLDMTSTEVVDSSLKKFEELFNRFKNSLGGCEVNGI